jgi:hypothetical protein
MPASAPGFLRDAHDVSESQGSLQNIELDRVVTAELGVYALDAPMGEFVHLQPPCQYSITPQFAHTGAAIVGAFTVSAASARAGAGAPSLLTTASVRGAGSFFDCALGSHPIMVAIPTMLNTITVTAAISMRG